MRPKGAVDPGAKEAPVPRRPAQNISLHIERLVLEGVPLGTAHRDRLHAAVVAELTRLLAEGGLAQHLSGGTALPSLRAGTIQHSSSAPSELGTRIAQAVYGGIGQ
jgi:hypothetical protein